MANYKGFILFFLPVGQIPNEPVLQTYGIGIKFPRFVFLFQLNLFSLS